MKVNGLTYKQWYKQVDDYVIAKAGVGIDDLADGFSVDCWRDEWTPQEYAEEQLESEGFYGY